ncbi:MAG: hypothetical protein AB7U73_01850 [Pirellulales bacterium]
MTSQESARVAPNGLKRTVAPTIQAVDLAGFKRHHGIDIPDLDLTLLEYIDAATEWCERYQCRALRQSTWAAVYDCFPADGVFYLPMPPLIAVSSITYLDAAGVSQTLDADVYTVDAISEPGRVALAYGQSWPTTLAQIAAVTITYTAGYTSATLIPAMTRQAIRLLVSHSYENKEAVAVGAPAALVPLSAIDLLEADRMVEYR